MQTKKIKLNATEDVKEFVQGASKCDFDVDVYYNRHPHRRQVYSRRAEHGSESDSDCEMSR